jgi:hypothetical protein
MLVRNNAAHILRLDTYLKNVSKDRLEAIKFEEGLTLKQMRIFRGEDAPKFSGRKPDGLFNAEYDCDFEESRFNNWELDYDDCHAENKFDCYTEVDIYAYGCHVDSRSLSFPIELLSATDDQIHLYAQEKYKK